MSQPVDKSSRRRLLSRLLTAMAVIAAILTARYVYRWSQSSATVRQITTKHFVVSYRGVPVGDA